MEDNEKGRSVRTDLQLGTWARIADHCPLESSVNGDGEIEMLMGGPTDGFEVVFTPEALARFLRVAGQALLNARERWTPDDTENATENATENRETETRTASI